MNRKPRPRLIDIFPNYFTSGIFHALQDYDVPWQESNIADELDIEYFGNVSGEKLISPLLEKLLTLGNLESEDVEQLAHIIFVMFGDNWGKQYATLLAEYNPIENYSMVEQMTDDETVTEYGKTVERTNDLTHAKTGTETTTPDITEVTTPNLTNTKNDSVWGFNSSSDSPSEKTVEGATGTNRVETDGTNEVEYDTSETDTGTVTDAVTGSDTQTRNYTLTRAGNIGVTTAQQMLESERQLWVWNFFYNVVFPDIDKILTIKIY